jgi:hypothetical protein
MLRIIIATFPIFSFMANYRWSICDPADPVIIEKGAISRGDILKTFEEFPWMDYLKKMASMEESDIHFSPSLEFENRNTGQVVTFSLVGDTDEHEFYIFYKRIKKIKYFFGLREKEVEGYLSDITGQTKADAIKFLNAFLDNDTEYMELQMR